MFSYFVLSNMFPFPLLLFGCDSIRSPNKSFTFHKHLISSFPLIIIKNSCVFCTWQQWNITNVFGIRFHRMYYLSNILSSYCTWFLPSSTVVCLFSNLQLWSIFFFNVSATSVRSQTGGRQSVCETRQSSFLTAFPSRSERLNNPSPAASSFSPW